MAEKRSGDTPKKDTPVLRPVDDIPTVKPAIPSVLPADDIPTAKLAASSVRPIGAVPILEPVDDALPAVLGPKTLELGQRLKLTDKNIQELAAILMTCLSKNGIEHEARSTIVLDFLEMHQKRVSSRATSPTK